MKIKLFILFFFITVSVFCQRNEINPNGYNVFYYRDSIKSSEGYMRDGKPDGYWKTFYETGILKSEGNRKFFLLDSIWNFYDIDGDIIKRINYRNDKKNGYCFTYEYFKEDSIKKGGLISKELFIDDIKQGNSYYYTYGILREIIPYKDGMKEGMAKEFSTDSIIITVTRYHKDYIIERTFINRKDPNGRKQGIWREYYANDKIKKEAYYVDDKLHGPYREYDINGKILVAHRYEKGVLIDDKIAEDAFENIKVVTDYYANGKIKYQKRFRDTVPVGIHKEYDEKGNCIRAKEYSDNGILLGIGIVDELGDKQGMWTFYYPTGEIKSKGNYIDNLRTGEWIFYFKNDTIEQIGSYINGRPDGTWKWYYPNGVLLREETFIDGVENGLMTEYNPDGSIITKGEYIEGEKEGPWFYQVGDVIQEGIYRGGQEDGVWKYYYKNHKLKFEGNYVVGLPDGEHRFYNEDGRLIKQEFYNMGKRHGNWKKYDSLGNLELTITYKDDEEIRINGTNINVQKRSDLK